MWTIQELITEKIRENPFLEELIASGLINISAFSRKIKPELEKKLMKPLSDSAVIMGTKRVADKLKDMKRRRDKTTVRISDITVKLNIIEFTFLQSETILTAEEDFISEAKGNSQGFFAFTHGLFEVTMLLSSEYEKSVSKTFKNEKLISKIENLSAIILKLPSNAYSTPGIYFNIIRHLAWENINIVEVISTLNEFTIILNNHEVEKAFSILKHYLNK